jgi:DNA repair photolyase
LPLIVSASRRTDIPAFYSDWFMNRAEAGFCLVPNPQNTKQVSYIPLTPDETDVIVFWTKNPAPMLKHIETLEDAGFRFYFQYTLNDYPKVLEPGVPPVSDRIETFVKLSGMIGPERVIWRYDPIIVSNRTGYSFHRENFSALCERLASFTRRVVVSIVDLYAKTERRLRKLEDEGLRFTEDPVNDPQMDDLLGDLARVARRAALEIATCAEKKDYSALGIPPGRCIDGDLIERLWHLRRSWSKDPGQRDACGCVASRDIGVNDSCLHNCPYCYATRSGEVACRLHENHDPHSRALLSDPEIPEKAIARQQLLFR